MKQLFLLIFLLSFFGNVTAQQTGFVDFKTASVDVFVDSQKKEVRGIVKYTFDVLKDVDSLMIDIDKVLKEE